MAAGLSLPRENVERFVQRINEDTGLTEEDLIPRIHIDVPMPFSYVTADLVRQLAVLEPFGKGNPKPVFADRNIRVKDSRIVGKNRNVLKLTLCDQTGRTYPAVYFGDVEQAEKDLQGQDTFSFIYYPQINDYQGQEQIEFILSSYC